MALVTLSGAVTRPVVKDDAGECGESITGVTDVVNNIRVLPLSSFDRSDSVGRISLDLRIRGLYRYAMGTQPSIHIIVDNGHVTLVGVVDNQADKDMANIRANSVPGVFSVTNDLRVVNKTKHLRNPCNQWPPGALAAIFILGVRFATLMRYMCAEAARAPLRTADLLRTARSRPVPESRTQPSGVPAARAGGSPRPRAIRCSSA